MIEIVIKIDDERYKDIQRIAEVQLDRSRFQTAEQVIANGIPLPKGHGRLGDLSKIYVELNERQIEGTEEYKGLGEAKQIVCNAPTIIEAESEE